MGLSILSINHKRAAELDIPTAMERLQSATGKVRIGAAHVVGPVLGMQTIVENPAFSGPPSQHQEYWQHKAPVKIFACGLDMLCQFC